MESVTTTTSSLSIGRGPPHGGGRPATGSGSARATGGGKRASIGISSNNKAFRAMAALANARTNSNNNGNSSSSSTGTGTNTSTVTGTAGSSNASSSIDKRQNRGALSISKSKGNSPATTTTSFPCAIASCKSTPCSHRNPSSAAPSALPYTPASSSTFHAAASASHSAAKPSSRLSSNGHDHDRHGLNLCQPQGFRAPAAHSARTTSTSTALKPVLPSPSPSGQSTVTTSAASNNSTPLWSVSAPNSASSTPIISKSAFTTRTSSSTPSSPALRAGSHKYTQKLNNRTTSPLLRQTPTLPVLSVVPPPGQDRGDGEARRHAMQRMSSFLPSWDKRNSAPRTGGFFGWAANRASTGPTSAPSPTTLAKINTAAANANARISLGNTRMQREAFWPATLDGECEKAARILKSFSTDGYLAPLEEDSLDAELVDAGTPVQITKKIPRRIIQNAAGIAIFTCMRSGLWMTGSGGSGILIARKSDGTWSPPSGIMLHTPALSFIIGVDIYDCVLVINNLAALESITKPRVTLGEDVGLTSGPLVSLDSDESHIRWKDLGNTVLTYMKSRGQNQSVDLNGCILTERANENERFYSSSITQIDILAGNVAREVDEVRPLSEVIKMAEGRSDYDASIIERIAIEPAPGDAMIATPRASTPASPRNPIAFGIPNMDDPDPFGVLALEMAGLEIREAGTRLRPESNQFDFNPAPSSPAFAKFSRQSVDNYGKTSSNRASFMSSRTVKSQMTDAGTQTDVGNNSTPETSPTPSRSDDGYGRASPTQIPEVTEEEEEEVDYTKIDMSPLKHLSAPQTNDGVTSQGTTTEQKDTLKVDQPSRDDTDKASSYYETEEDEEIDEDNEDDKVNEDDKAKKDEKEATADRAADEEEEMDDSEDEEEPVIFEVAAIQPARTQAVTSRVIHAKGSVVTIPKRVPPPLPVRNPGRASRSSKTEIGDVSHLKSPMQQEFTDVDTKSDEETQPKRQSSPYLRPVQVKIVSAKLEKSRDSIKSESDSDLTPVLEADVKSDEAAKVEDDEAESTESTSTPKTDVKATEPRISVPHLQHSDSSDSLSKKHTSSIYTGVTEDRWSMDGSSLTTPTSDRPFSVIGDVTEDETPRKLKETDRIELNEKYDELEKIGSKETTPNTITVA